MSPWLSLRSLTLFALLGAASHAGSAADVRWEAFNGGGGGCNGTINSVATSGDTVVVGGSFTLMGNAAANNIALWDGKSWHALGKGVNGRLASVAFDSKGGLFVGGNFDSAGDVRSSCVAHWDGKTWSSLNDSTKGRIESVVPTPGGALYVGGSFSFIGGKAIRGVARWNGGRWEPVGSGVNGTVTRLVWDRNGELFAAGWFDTAGGARIVDLARYSGGVWSSMGGRKGTYDTRIMLDRDGSLIAANLDSLLMARWNGTGWDSITTMNLEASYSWHNATNFITSWTRDSTGVLWIVGRRKASAGAMPYEYWSWKLGAKGWEQVSWNVSPSADGMATDPAGRIFFFGTGFMGRDILWDGLPSGLSVMEPTRYVYGAGFQRSQKYYPTRNTIKVNARGHVLVLGATYLDQKLEAIQEWDGVRWKGISHNLGYNNEILDVAIGGEGSVFASNNYMIFRHDSVGQKWDSIGSYGGYTSAARLEADGDGNLYVCGGFRNFGGNTIRDIAFWNAKTRTWSGLGEAISSDTSFKAQQIRLLPDGRLALSGVANVTNIAIFGIWNPTTKAWTLDTHGKNCSSVDLLVSPSGKIYGLSDGALCTRDPDTGWVLETYGTVGYKVPGRIAVDAKENIYGFILGTTPQKPQIGVLQPSRYDRKLKQWEPLGSGFNHEKVLSSYDEYEFKEAIALDPAGKRLYALGNFTRAGDVVSPWVATADVSDLGPAGIAFPTTAGRHDLLRLTRQGAVLSQAWQGSVDLSILDLQGRRIWGISAKAGAVVPYPVLASGAWIVRARSATQSHQTVLMHP